MMVALAMPPPSHIVCSPYRPPRCSSAFTSVVMMRAPLAPSGWPIAMAPPLTLVLPRSAPVSAAKALATGDMLCGGRPTVGLGVGGRVEDYRAVGADPATQTMRGMAESVAVMKRVWTGEKITESVLPVGPAPVQSGGPPLLVGTIGPKTLRSAAAWADGLAGNTLDLDVAKQNALFDVARDAWSDGGKTTPHLATSFWFALGSVDEARRQVHRHLRRYMNWIPVEYIDAMAPTTGFAGSEEERGAGVGVVEAGGSGGSRRNRPNPAHPNQFRPRTSRAGRGPGRGDAGRGMNA